MKEVTWAIATRRLKSDEAADKKMENLCRILQLMDIYNFILGMLFNFDQYSDLSVIDECSGLFITNLLQAVNFKFILIQKSE